MLQVVLSLCLLINGVLVVAAVVLTGALNTNLVVPVAVSLFLFTVFSLIKVNEQVCQVWCCLHNAWHCCGCLHNARWHMINLSIAPITG